MITSLPITVTMSGLYPGPEEGGRWVNSVTPVINDPMSKFSEKYNPRLVFAGGYGGWHTPFPCPNPSPAVLIRYSLADRAFRSVAMSDVPKVRSGSIHSAKRQQEEFDHSLPFRRVHTSTRVLETFLFAENILMSS